jgi:hypothetical protein
MLDWCVFGHRHFLGRKCVNTYLEDHMKRFTLLLVISIVTFTIGFFLVEPALKALLE